MGRTHQIVHQTITAQHNYIPLHHLDVVSRCVFHWLVARMRAELQGEVKGVLHLVGPENNLIRAYDDKTAVAEIRDAECRIVQKSKEAGGRPVYSLLSA